jgi:hypothetical protein
MKRLAALTFVLLSLGLPLGSQACGGPTFIVQQYAGPARPAGTIAVVRFNGRERLLWDSLDGEAAQVQVPEDSRLHVEVLPGTHRVGVRDPSAPEPAHVAAFFAEPGKVYRPVFAPGAGSALRVYEVDASSDALVRDVTLAPTAATSSTHPPAPAPASRPPPALTLKPDPDQDAAAAEIAAPPAEAGAAP